jgi:hypothetical protein
MFLSSTLILCSETLKDYQDLLLRVGKLVFGGVQLAGHCGNILADSRMFTRDVSTVPRTEAGLYHTHGHELRFPLSE